MSSFPRQRETPTRPHYARGSGSRSPTKLSRQELGLSLDQVIGSTCQSVTRFACDKGSNSFAYTTGAAVVLTTRNDDSRISQRFFRASASQTAVSRPPPTSNAPSTPSALAQEMRSRLGHRTREGSPFAGSGPVETSESPGGTSGHAKDKVKAVTAVALSRGGRWLAFGETGYRPRVVVFPVTEKRSTETPSAIISEHSFGVHAVAFDSEVKLLASLGTINDGFLHVWDLDSRTGAVTLLASNKCTSLIKQMVWMGRSLVTVGTRHVKVWRPDEIAPSSGLDHDQAQMLSAPSSKPLVGRNCLLGEMLEATFTTISTISEKKAILCSDSGDVLLLELDYDEFKQQTLSRISSETFSITAVCAYDEDHVLITGTNGSIKKINITNGRRSDTPVSRAATPSPRHVEQKSTVYPIAIGALRGGIVASDNRHAINFRPGSSTDELQPTTSASNIVESHNDAILGIRHAPKAHDAGCTFLTWSSGGKVIGWSDDGQALLSFTIDLDQSNDSHDFTNELRSLASFQNLPLIAAGDRYGILRSAISPRRDFVC